MHFDEYQDLAERTSSFFFNPDDVETSRERFIVAALGLAGESGEVCDRIKKHIGQGHPADDWRTIADELGDVLWYVAEMASALGLSLEHVAQRNIDKLRKRYPDGFSSDRSMNRQESE